MYAQRGLITTSLCSTLLRLFNILEQLPTLLITQIENSVRGRLKFTIIQYHYTAPVPKSTSRWNLGQVAERCKDRYDLCARPATFPVGSWIWCWVPRTMSGRYQKWRSLYQGPFKGQLGPVTYEIQRNKCARCWTVHVDKLKPCHDPEEEKLDSRLPVDASEITSDDDQASDVQGSRPCRVIRKPRHSHD